MAEPQALLNFVHNAHIFASAVGEILEKKYLRQATDQEINFPQFNLLRLIEHNGDHQIREIASFLGVSQAAASKNVDKLVRLGLVKRQVQEGDRRAVSLNLTLRGRNVIQKYEVLKEEKLAHMLQELTQAELETLSRGLERASYLILEKEEDFGEICMKCSAYHVEGCPMRSLADGCIYVRSREQAVH